jgi:hypothetical protein
VWFTTNGSTIGEINPSTHAINEFTLPTNSIAGITAGPGGNLWFITSDAGIGSFNPRTQAVHMFGAPPGTDLTVGPDGNLWYAAGNNIYEVIVSQLPAPPAVTGLSPSLGSPAGGTTVTITGSSLSGATAVHFGANAATIVSDSANQIVAVSPPGGLGEADVTVTTAGGTSAISAKDKFTYINVPTITVNIAGGTYNGGPFQASARATDAHGAAVNGSFAYNYYAGSTKGKVLAAPPTNAGTYTVVASFTSSQADYGSLQTQVTFTITQAIPTVAVIDAGGAYNGRSFPATATALGLSGTPLKGSFVFTYYSGTTMNGPGSQAAPTRPGTYTVVGAFTSHDPNYRSTQGVPVTFTISVGLSLGSAAPGQTLTIPGTAFGPTVPIYVVFTNTAGQAIRVRSESATVSTVSVLVPPLLDSSTLQPVAGTVAVAVEQDKADGTRTSKSFGHLHISALAQTGLATGTVTLAVLKQIQDLLAAAQQHWLAIQKASQGTVAASALEQNLAGLAQQITNLQNQVQDLVNGTVPQINLGQSNGHTVFLDASGLADAGPDVRGLLAGPARYRHRASSTASLPRGPGGGFPRRLQSKPGRLPAEFARKV